MGTLGKNRATVTTAIAALLLSGVSFCLPVIAATPAATEVTNIAEVEYGNSQNQASNNETFTVQELTDLELVALDSSPVNVATPSQQLLSFELTHTGNGQQAYELLLSQSNTDDFDANDLELWLDSDGDGMFDDTLDSLYDPGNLPVLGPGEKLVIFVRLDVPAGQALNDAADISLTATASGVGSEVGNPGGTIDGAGENGTDLVVGANGAQQTATTQLLVSNSAAIEIDKRVSNIEDPQGGSEPVPGAHISYELTIRFVGEGELTNIVITDAIPNDTEYRAGSLTLDNVNQTDDADTDAGQFDAGNNQILVELGDITAPHADFVVTFQTTIQ